MPAYEIYFLCSDCKSEHPLHIRLHLDSGPARKETLVEFLCGRSLPPQLAALRGHKALCLRTGRTIKLENDEQILLAPSPTTNQPVRQFPSNADER
jgi:hypothetical protein